MATTETLSLDLESGSTQYAAIANGSQTGLGLTGDFTIEAWIWIESDTGNDQTIAGKWNGTAGQRSYAFSYNKTSNELKLFVRNSADDTSGSAVKAVTLPLSSWNHVAVAFDISAASAEFFVNGATLGTATGTLPTTILNGTASFAVGGIEVDSTPSSLFDGKLKYVRVFSDLRSSAEIVTDMVSNSVANADLEGEWSFESVYTDGSGNGNTLTSSGSPTFASSVPGYYTAYSITQSADLELSSSQYFSRADTASLSITGALTLECWVNPESFASENMLITKQDSGSNRSFILDTVDVGGGDIRLRVRINDSPGDGSVTSDCTGLTNLASLTGTWVHLAATWDITNPPKVFVNGVNDSNTATDTNDAGAVYDNSATIRLGTVQTTPTLFWDGRISLARVWSTDRLESVLAASMCTVFGTTANLAAEWTLDNTLNDNSGNGNTLTNNNTTTFSAGIPGTCAIVGPTGVKTFDGVTQSTGMKTYVGVALASTKTVIGIS